MPKTKRNPKPSVATKRLCRAAVEWREARKALFFKLDTTWASGTTPFVIAAQKAEAQLERAVAAYRKAGGK